MTEPSGGNGETSPESETPVRKVGRKDFLKLSAAATVAVGTLAAGLYSERRNLAALSISELLKNPDLLNSILETTANGLDAVVLKDKRDPQAPEVTENLSYNSILSQITEAVDSYTQKGGTVTYTRNPGWRSDDYYIDRLRAVLENPSISLDYRDKSPIDLFRDLGEFGGIYLQKEFDKLVPEETRSILNYHDIKIFMPMRLNDGRMVNLPPIVKGSGLYDRVYQRTGVYLPSIEDSSRIPEANNPLHSKWGNVIEAGKEYLDEIQQFTEDAVRQNGGKPISSSAILEFLLEQNNGALDKSMLDLATFLQYMGRRTRGSADLEPAASPDEEWMTANILDEYGKIINYSVLSDEKYPYNGHLPRSMYGAGNGGSWDHDLSRINQVGKPYHAWAIVAKLIAFPPTVLKIGSIKDNWFSVSQQGLSKVSADMHVAAELDRIDGFLRKFDRKELPPNVVIIERPEARYRIIYGRHDTGQKVEDVGNADALVLEYVSRDYSTGDKAEKTFNALTSSKQYLNLVNHLQQRRKPVFLADMNSIYITSLLNGLKALEPIIGLYLISKLAIGIKRQAINRRNFIRTGGARAIAALWFLSDMPGLILSASQVQTTKDEHSASRAVNRFLTDLEERIHPETEAIVMTLRNHLFAQKLKTIADMMSSHTEGKPEVGIVIGARHTGIEAALQKEDQERVELINRLLHLPGLEETRAKIATIARMDFDEDQHVWVASIFKDPHLAPLEQNR